MGYRTIIARYVAQWGIAHMRLCELSTKGGIARFWGSANLPEKHNIGYRSDSIAASRDMGPLRWVCGHKARIAMLHAGWTMGDLMFLKHLSAHVSGEQCCP